MCKMIGIVPFASLFITAMLTLSSNYNDVSLNGHYPALVSNSPEMPCNLFSLLKDSGRYCSMKNDRHMNRLIGFKSKNGLINSDEMVSVIVVFKHAPLPPATLDGKVNAAYEEALRLVEKDHSDFQLGLNNLFDNSSLGDMYSYKITATYKNSINGVAITLPNNMVSKLADIECVGAIHPNEIIRLDPIETIITTPVDR